MVEKKHGKIHADEDLIDIIWKDRPALSKAPVMIYDDKYTGENIKDKLKKGKTKNGRKRCHTSPYVFTLRYSMAFKCQRRRHKLCSGSAFVSCNLKGQLYMVLQEEIITPELKEYLDDNNITTRPYDSFMTM